MFDLEIVSDVDFMSDVINKGNTDASLRGEVKLLVWHDLMVVTMVG